MPRTYKAVLRGDRLEWIDPPPEPLHPTAVHITLLDDEPAPVSGRDMAAALKAIAENGGLSGIGDPLEWQRETRADRPLPRRGE